MSMHPRSLIANIVSGTLTAIIVVGLGYFIYEKQDSFSLFAPSSKIESDFSAVPKPIASERIDEEQVENEMNRIAEEKRKEEARKKAAEEAKRKAEEARKKAEAEKKRLAELEAKKKAEAAEQKRLDEIALKKKQEEEKKKKDEEARQQKLAEEKKEKQKQEEIQRQKEAKAVADKKAAEDAEKKRKAEEAKKAAAAKAKADADAKAKAAAKADGLRALEDAGYQARLAEAFKSQWNIGMDAIGYTAVVAIRVDKTGKILEIIEAKSRWSKNDAFDANVRATIWRVGKVPLPNSQNGVNQLANEILELSFDPKDMGLSYY